MLALDKEDGTAIRCLETGQLIEQLAEVEAYPLEKRLVRLAKRNMRHFNQPGRQASGVIAVGDERARPEHDPHSRLVAQLHESADIGLAGKTETALARLMQSPRTDRLDRVETRLGRGGDPIRPCLHRHSGVVDRPAQDPNTPAVDRKALTVVRHASHGRECSQTAGRVPNLGSRPQPRLDSRLAPAVHTTARAIGRNVFWTNHV